MKLFIPYLRSNKLISDNDGYCYHINVLLYKEASPKHDKPKTYAE